MQPTQNGPSAAQQNILKCALTSVSHKKLATGTGRKKSGRIVRYDGAFCWRVVWTSFRHRKSDKM